MKLIYIAPALLTLAAGCATSSAERAEAAPNEVTCRYLVDSSVGGRNARECMTNSQWAAYDYEAADRRDKLGLFVGGGSRGAY